MVQGQKRGERHPVELRAKALAMHFKEGVPVKDIGTALKVSYKTVGNWVTKYNKGRFDMEGRPTKARKAPKPRSPDKQPRKKRQDNPQQTSRVKALMHAATDDNKAVTLLKLRVERLEAENVFLKRDRAALEIALEALS